MFLYKQIYLKQNVEMRNSLQVIYGVNWYKSNLAASRVGVSYPFSIDNLNSYAFALLSCVLDGLTWLEVRIKREITSNIGLLVNMENYKGLRHRDSLPCRGQRTRTNAKSVRRLQFKV